jgi:membrane-bound ClpP family serine protease
VRQTILIAISQPAVAAALLTVGWVGVVAEFLRPGKVIPGAVGGVLIVLALWGLVPQQIGLAIFLTCGLGVLALPFLRIAWRARRNKLAR